MTEVDGGHFCSVNISSLLSKDYDYAVPLDDTQEFNIFLCSSNVSSTCSLLIKEYTPQTNSRERLVLCSCCVGSSLPLHDCAFVNTCS